jgi:phenylalanyl-tRNA synthetase beta chain
MVYCGKTPVAIGGIIGGLDSSVTNTTTRVVIEAAQFSAQKIRKGIKSLNLRTDAASHFEKGIDRNLIQYALNRAVALITELSSGKACKATITAERIPYTPKQISLRPVRVNQLIGTQLSNSEIEEILARIGCKVLKKDENHILFEIPSVRNDIHEEIDLIEEVARIYGYNHIPKSSGFFRKGHLDNHPIYTFETTVRQLLMNLGLQEMITCNLIGDKLSQIGLGQGLETKHLISMLHAKSVDQSILRPSLLPTLLQVVRLNFNQQVKTVSGFEIGRVHFKEGGQHEEKFAIGIILTGKRESTHFSKEAAQVDFFDLKGLLEALFEELHVPFTQELSEDKVFHPGQQAAIKIHDEIVGIFGQVHPNQTKKLDLDVPIFFAQIDLVPLMKASLKPHKFKLLPQFPGSTRDLTLTLEKSISYQKVLDSIHAENQPLLKDVEFIGLYTSEQIGARHQNVTLRFTYRSDDKTLDFDTVENAHGQLVKALTGLVS